MPVTHECCGGNKTVWQVEVEWEAVEMGVVREGPTEERFNLKSDDKRSQPREVLWRQLSSRENSSCKGPEAQAAFRQLCLRYW